MRTTEAARGARLVRRLLLFCWYFLVAWCSYLEHATGNHGAGLEERYRRRCRSSVG